MENIFDQIIDRKGTNCKWDYRPSERILPFNVADMDFACPKAILDDLHKRVESGAFGYTNFRGQDLYDAINGYQQRHFGYQYNESAIFHCNGIVAALGYLIDILTEEQDAVLVHNPVYPSFFSKVNQCNCKLIMSDIKMEQGKYTVNFDDFEEKIIAYDVKLFILCHPHNPIGKAYSFAELRQIGEICKRHHVIIISDEIHRDFYRSHLTHIPLEKALPDYKDYIITCFSPSKTYNLAGMVYSFVVINHQEYRHKWIAYVNHRLSIEEGNSNTLSRVSAISAFTKCDDWLQELRHYLDGNFRLLEAFLKEYFPLTAFSIPEATYFAWIDFSAYDLPNNINEFLINHAEIAVGNGSIYGENINGYIRLCLACPRSMLIDGLDRMKEAIKKYQNEKRNIP